MPAATFTAVASFKQILFGKHPVPFFRKVEVTFFQGDNLLHNNGLYAYNALLKNTTFKGNIGSTIPCGAVVVWVRLPFIHRKFAIFMFV